MQELAANPEQLKQLMELSKILIPAALGLSAGFALGFVEPSVAFAIAPAGIAVANFVKIEQLDTGIFGYALTTGVLLGAITRSKLFSKKEFRKSSNAPSNQYRNKKK